MDEKDCSTESVSFSKESLESFSDFEENLLSLERLDRASPELWPEAIPGVSDFVAFNTPPDTKPVYSTVFTNEDNNLMHHFASLSTGGVIAKVKELHDIAYQLGLEESKEMTRGKFLNLLKKKSRKK